MWGFRPLGRKQLDVRLERFKVEYQDDTTKVQKQIYSSARCKRRCYDVGVIGAQCSATRTHTHSPHAHM